MRRILVLAGSRSDPGQPGLARAAALARRTGAGLTLFDVVYDPHLEGYLGDTDAYASLRQRLVAERQERLTALAAALEARGLRCDAKASWAHPAHLAIVREAAAADVDLVLLEPEDLKGGLSNDEWRLISISPAPVLVARDSAVRPYTRIVAAIDPLRRHDKPADLDAKILALAAHMRELTDAKLEVVHCVPPLDAFIRDDAAAGVLRNAEAAIRARRQHELGELVAQAGLPAQAAQLIPGKPADVLAEKSAAGDAPLLVLGTAQRGPIARLLVGSTAERVLRSAGGDILIIKPAFVGGDTQETGRAMPSGAP